MALHSHYTLNYSIHRNHPQKLFVMSVNLNHQFRHSTLPHNPKLGKDRTIIEHKRHLFLDCCLRLAFTMAQNLLTDGLFEKTRSD